MIQPAFCLEENIPLAPKTTLELGGNAQFFVHAYDQKQAIQAVTWADMRQMPVTLLGGGSNMVIADGGIPGLVVRLEQQEWEIIPQPLGVRLVAKAGVVWDSLVALAVQEGLVGMECLSGIPGTVGAAPIQNIGAYGQEVASTIETVTAFDREKKEVVLLSNKQCCFEYRNSIFKKHPQRYVVLEVAFFLHKGNVGVLAYPELARAVATKTAQPSLKDVRETVLALRRSKSMVWDLCDENHRSVGSFFLNPIVSFAEAQRVAQDAVSKRLIEHETQMPQYITGKQTKLSAAWLIEKAGIPKGFKQGPVGISTKHTLCLVHHGGGQAKDLIALAKHVQKKVYDAFAVPLSPEPMFAGFATPPL